MGLFGNQLLNVIEWNESRDDVIFWKWRNNEIKKGSRLIIKPGQDAIFLYNGKIEGVFRDEGNYEIENQILPFLSTLKGFKFGFNSGLRAEVLFINTKEFMVKWGTKNSVNIQTPKMPGGMPIRSFGTFSVKINDYFILIDKVAGIKQEFTVDDVKERVLALLDQLLMKWISKEGKDIFNLQANAYDISKGIKEDLDSELVKMGLSVAEFAISSFNYPEKIQQMIEKNASFEMVGDVSKYQTIEMTDAMSKNKDNGMLDMAQAGAGMAMGMQMMNQMTQNMTGNMHSSAPAGGVVCSNCGQMVAHNVNFCGGCGQKVVKPSAAPTDQKKFCSNCGEKVEANTKFCGGCGNKMS